jgi:thymidine kinase
MKARLIIVEEGQFFEDLVPFVLHAVEKDGKDVVVIGLDGDVHRKPFTNISELVALADKVMRLHALCMNCGDGTPAIFTKAINSAIAMATLGGKPNVGGAEAYLPVCRKHYFIS